MCKTPIPQRRTWLSLLVLGSVLFFSNFLLAGPNAAGAGRHFSIYKLLPAVLTGDDATAFADQFGLVPAEGANGGQMAFSDADGNVRLFFADGSLKFFPSLGQASPAPSRDDALGIAKAFIIAILKPAPEQPTFVPGEVTTLTTEGATLGSGTPGIVGGGQITLGEPMDVLRNVQFIRMMDGLKVFGPSSIVSFDVGAGGVVGADISLRGIDPNGMPVKIISKQAALKLFLSEFPYPITSNEDEHESPTAEQHENEHGKDEQGAGDFAPPGTTTKIVSMDLIYYEQGMQYVQPAYLFRVITTSPGGLTTGHTWLVPAVQNTIEPIVNMPVRDLNPPTYAQPGFEIPPYICQTPETIKYGRYLLRDDDPGWTKDINGFSNNIQVSNTLLRFFFPSHPPVENAQYYWNYPWLWQPSGSPPTDQSPYFPGSVNTALIEGHGAPWLITTEKNCCDVIYLPNITGFGGFHDPSELTDYVIWQSCDVIPAPGDPYGGAYTSPASPFDVWFHMFQGMRGTYGYHTTMNIWNGVGSAFGGDMGWGVPNLSAWFTECNNNVFHHGGGWNYGSAVLISGHEGDSLYDTCPLPPPGSLTIWWQHP
jgi:hypothetical protein